MKFRKIFSFEFAYQLRNVSTWIYCAVLVVAAFLMMRFSTPTDESCLNAPAHIAFATVFGSLIWLLIAAAVAGDAAARDVQTRMYSLPYTSLISKAVYLGGRFLAAFALNALLQLSIPAGTLLAFYAPGAETGLLGLFRPAAYLSAYGFITLPIAFVATEIQFSLATLSCRAIASYGSVLLLVSSLFWGHGPTLWAMGTGEAAGSNRHHRHYRRICKLDTHRDEYPADHAGGYAAMCKLP